VREYTDKPVALYKALAMQQPLSRRSVLKVYAAWSLALVLDGCGGGISDFSRNGRGLATSNWPKYRGNLRNTGQASGRGCVGELRWNVPAGTADRVEGSAIIGPDGSVYIGVDDGRVYAFNGSTGAVLWATIVQTAGVDSTPALGADGLLYVGAGHSVVALFSGTGIQKWRFATAGDVESSPALAPDGTLYFGADDANVYAVHSGDGSLKWVFAFPDDSNTDSSPAVGADGTVYIGSDKGTLYALDGQRGSLKWSFQALGEISGAPAIGSDGTIYICALNSAKTESVTYAINGKSGLQSWALPHASQSGPSVAIGMDGTVFVSGVALAGIIDGVAIEPRATVWAIDGSTGIQKWEQGLEAGSPGVTAILTDAAGILYVQSERPTALGGVGKLTALEPLTGRIQWEFATGGSSNSSPAMGADGTVFVGSDDGRVYAIS
jgi:outer membrane protein assembly factor BamB